MTLAHQRPCGVRRDESDEADREVQCGLVHDIDVVVGNREARSDKPGGGIGSPGGNVRVGHGGTTRWGVFSVEWSRDHEEG